MLGSKGLTNYRYCFFCLVGFNCRRTPCPECQKNLLTPLCCLYLIPFDANGSIFVNMVPTNSTFLATLDVVVHMQSILSRWEMAVYILEKMVPTLTPCHSDNLN